MFWINMASVKFKTILREYEDNATTALKIFRFFFSIFLIASPHFLQEIFFNVSSTEFGESSEVELRIT